MTGFIIDIEKKTLENDKFREVLYTTDRTQFVVMTVQPGDDIGLEVHDDHDQFIRIEGGEGKAVLGGEETPLQDGSAVVIPAGTEHNIVNTSADQPLKLYTIYAPPEHPDGTVHETKAEAEEYEKEHHG